MRKDDPARAVAVREPRDRSGWPRPAIALLAGGLWVGGSAIYGQQLPATPATTSSAAAQSGNGAAASADGPERHKAEVVVRGGQLEIRADNSSLNQILRAISQQTGMTISGGVNDQRVFGTYGPGAAAQVISDLLEDTGTNMLLKMTPQGAPAELILSQRTGGASPPSPAAARVDPRDVAATAVGASPAASAPASSGQPQQRPQSQVPPLPFSQPPAQPAETDPFVTPQTPSPGGIVGAPTVAPATEPGTTPGPETQSTGTSSPPADTSGSNNGSTNGSTTNPASPNGVKTPQQIYQELQKLLQQQQQQDQGQGQSGSQ